MEGAAACGAIETRGSNYYLGDLKLGIGREKTITALRADPALFKSVYDAVYAAVRSGIKVDKSEAIDEDNNQEDNQEDSQEPKDTSGDENITQYLDSD